MQRVRSAYALTAIILLNTTVIFAALNVAAAGWLWSQRDEPLTYERAWLIDGYGIDTLARNYPDLSRDDLTTLLYETSNWIHEYEPFTGFRPVRTNGK